MKYLFLLLPFLGFQVLAQDPMPFAEEVGAIERKYDSLWDPSRETIVFTGSSSIRLWTDLEKRFPNHQVVNTGFGGSQASDLDHYLDPLVLRFDPKKVFIYEGDNDLSSGKKPKVILDTFTEIIAKIRRQDPETKIVLIAAKPSMARWALKRKYKKLNRKFKKLGKGDPLIDFADVWSPMLNKRKLKEQLFIDDGLHMNAEGYELWYRVIKEYVGSPDP